MPPRRAWARSRTSTWSRWRTPRSVRSPGCPTPPGKSSADYPNGDAMAELWHKVKHEFQEVLPPTIFFLITFHIVLLDRALMLREYGLHLSSIAAAAVMALLVHYLEHLVPLWWKTGSFTEGNRDLWREIVWPHFWAIQLWLVVLIFVYCASRELIRIIGRERVVHIFFGHPPPSMSGGSGPCKAPTPSREASTIRSGISKVER